MRAVVWSILFVLFTSVGLSLANGFSGEEMLPVVEPGPGKMMVMVNESRRKLGSFQICGLCTCCGGGGQNCLTSPCCYAINCHIPNKPYGFCSFTPKACNCFGCL